MGMQVITYLPLSAAVVYVKASSMSTNRETLLDIVLDKLQKTGKVRHNHNAKKLNPQGA